MIAVSSNMTGKNTVPLWLKLAFTAFMAVLVPVYSMSYGPTNFLYFCDAALFLTLFALWADSALAASMAAVGILVPQIFWCIDFAFELSGTHLTHMTSYMFNAQHPLFLRGLSLFHGWLPFLLIYLVRQYGYDRRALPAWTALAWALCLIAFFLLPPAGAHLANPNTPINVDYVYGTNDDVPEHFLPAGEYLVLWMLALLTVFYIPMHFVLARLFGQPQNAAAGAEPTESAA
jgi:hypothetical protein